MDNNLKVTFASTTELIIDPQNTREHSSRNIDAIKRSIQQFGIRKPIVAKEDTKIVYAGNATLIAAQQLEIEKIPVAWIPMNVSETVCKAYAIADNKIAELANWNTKWLDIVISEIQDIDIDIKNLGFNEIELELLLKPIEFSDDKAMGKEYDENIANEMEMIECPKCHHKFI